MNMITTLTLNPAFDIHANLNEFNVEHENLANSVTRDIGGKGINISRALTENHIKNTALVVLGSENAEEFRSGLLNENIDFVELTRPGRIRENITIHPVNSKETRLSFKGFKCDDQMLDEVFQMLGDVSQKIITFTGSIPTGISQKAVEDFLTELKKRRALVVIDSKSVSLESLRRIKPWLIKPNDEEMETYFGKLDKVSMLNAAKSLHSDGISNVLISLGAKGSLLVSNQGVFRAEPPKINAISTIGAGDSMIAGFIAATSQQKDDIAKLRTASAFGSAACLREGTNPPLANDISSLSEKIKIQQEE